jgi:hypothetical protein
MANNPIYQSLSYYEAKAKDMTDAALRHSLSDVIATLECWPRDADTPYVRKLWAEKDAYSVEISRRQKNTPRRPQVNIVNPRMGRIRAA